MIQSTSDISILAAAQVTETDVRSARLGTRFGRLDLASQMALLAVESLDANFDAWPRERIGLCLAARTGSLSTDVEYWKGRDAVGGPSPMLFTYTLPSSALGEIAIRHRITGPNLCFVGADSVVLAEAADMIRRSQADGCVCVSCNAVTGAAAEMIQEPGGARACALFLTRGEAGPRAWRELDSDMESLCATFRPQKSAT